MVRRKQLQSFQRVGYHDKRRVKISVLGLTIHHEGTDTFFVKVVDITVTVVAVALQGKKQGLTRIHQMTTVDEQVADIPMLRLSDQFPVDDFRNVL